MWSLGGYRLFCHLMVMFMRPEAAAPVAVFVHLTLSLTTACLILIGAWQVIHVLQSKVYRVYSVAAVAVLTFYVVLRGFDLYHFILITRGGGYVASHWRPIGLLVLPPVGIISCYIVASRAVRCFQLPNPQLNLIRLLAASLGVIWLLGIVLSFVQWWDSRDKITFSLAYLVIRNHAWQRQSAFYSLIRLVYTLPVVLWQVCLFVFLWMVKRQPDQLP